MDPLSIFLLIFSILLIYGLQGYQEALVVVGLGHWTYADLLMVLLRILNYVEGMVIVHLDVVLEVTIEGN